jgi:hypothetical protein
MSVARRERKYGGPESDRTKRVLSQPVQAWYVRAKNGCSHSY